MLRCRMVCWTCTANSPCVLCATSALFAFQLLGLFLKLHRKGRKEPRRTQRRSDMLETKVFEVRIVI